MELPAVIAGVATGPSNHPVTAGAVSVAALLACPFIADEEEEETRGG